MPKDPAPRPARRATGDGSLPSRDGLHPRNRHRGRYDLPRLIGGSPELAGFVAPNAWGDASIDFADPAAVKALNRALLAADYGIAGWDIPAGYLCPPIPGRVDYLHRLADLLAESCAGRVPTGAAIRVLDVGCGANCIYPLLGHAEYGWHFVGSDIDRPALAAAQATLAANPASRAAIELRLQTAAGRVFAGIIGDTERFALTLCNPPFHASLDEARAGTARKWQNLDRGKTAGKAARLNFGGRAAELCCPGGEAGFVGRMLDESRHFAGQCLWFSSLVAKAASLPGIERALARAGVSEWRVIEMAQGQKRSRIVAWSFIELDQRAAWLAQA